MLLDCIRLDLNAQSILMEIRSPTSAMAIEVVTPNTIAGKTKIAVALLIRPKRVRQEASTIVAGITARLACNALTRTKLLAKNASVNKTNSNNFHRKASGRPIGAEGVES